MEENNSEDFEYHVVFPPMVSSPTDEGEECFGDGQENESRETVVVLLGWLGSLDKHLAKYSAIYQQRGYVTICYTAPMKHVFFDGSKLRETAKKILELLFDLGLEENNIFFHVFSNAGGFLYRHITEILHDPKSGELTLLRVNGCMYDSSPCEVTLKNMFLAKFYANPQNLKGGIFKRIINAFIILAGVFAYFFYPPAWATLRLGFSYMSALKNDRARYPQLFLYSKADLVCNYKPISYLVAERRMLGVRVDEQCWVDSGHCTHLLAHKDEYIKLCHKFVDKCLSEGTEI